MKVAGTEENTSDNYGVKGVISETKTQELQEVHSKQNNAIKEVAIGEFAHS